LTVFINKIYSPEWGAGELYEFLAITQVRSEAKRQFSRLNRDLNDKLGLKVYYMHNLFNKKGAICSFKYDSLLF